MVFQPVFVSVVRYRPSARALRVSFRCTKSMLILGTKTMWLASAWGLSCLVSHRIAAEVDKANNSEGPSATLPPDDPQNLLLSMYRCAIESYSISDRKALHRVISNSQKITGCPPPSKTFTTPAASAEAGSSSESHPSVDVTSLNRRPLEDATGTLFLFRAFFQPGIEYVNCCI